MTWEPLELTGEPLELTWEPLAKLPSYPKNEPCLNESAPHPKSLRRTGESARAAREPNITSNRNDFSKKL